MSRRLDADVMSPQCTQQRSIFYKEFNVMLLEVNKRYQIFCQYKLSAKHQTLQEMFNIDTLTEHGADL